VRLPLGAREEEHDLASDGVLGILQTSTPKGARPTVALRPPELHSAIAIDQDIAAVAIQPLARWAGAGQLLRIKAEVLGPESPRGIYLGYGFVPLGGGQGLIAVAEQRVGEVAVDPYLEQVLRVALGPKA